MKNTRRTFYPFHGAESTGFTGFLLVADCHLTNLDDSAEFQGRNWDFHAGSTANVPELLAPPVPQELFGYSFYDWKATFSILSQTQVPVTVTMMRRIFPQSEKSCAIATLLCLLFMNGCVISPRRTAGGGSGGGGGTAAGGKLYVTSGSSILRFDNALSATGDIAPGGTITGTSTTLSSPHALQIDTATDRLYVANQGGGSVLVFSAASTLTGNVAPTATVGSGSTGLSSPIGVAVDTTRNLLYVADGTSISIFNGASTLSGTVNTAPAQSFITGFTISEIFLDAANNIIYATDAADNTVAVYQSANAQSGVGFANGTIVGPDTGLSQPAGAALDTAGRLIVSGPGVPNLTVFSNPTVASGDVLPAAVIKGSSTGLSSPAQMAITKSITNGALYVADSRASSVLIYSPISNVTGTVNLAPSRQLSGATTTLSGPTGIALDSTR